MFFLHTKLFCIYLLIILGLGFYHGRETKHDGPLKKQCKGCSSCASMCNDFDFIFLLTDIILLQLAMVLEFFLAGLHARNAKVSTKIT